MRIDPVFNAGYFAHAFHYTSIERRGKSEWLRENRRGVLPLRIAADKPAGNLGAYPEFLYSKPWYCVHMRCKKSQFFFCCKFGKKSGYSLVKVK